MVTAVRNTKHLNRPMANIKLAAEIFRFYHAVKWQRILVSCCFFPLSFLLIPSKAVQAKTWADHTIRPYVSLGTSYDSNLLRSAGSVVGSKGSFITQLGAGFDMDWTLSSQQLLIRAIVNENIFENFSSLDYVGWDTLAQWNWQLGSHASGEIGYSNKHYLSSFGQVNQLIANLVDEEKYFANGGYFFHPNWQVRGGFNRNNWSYDSKDRQISNNSEDTGEIGLQYLSPSRDMAGVRVSLISGSYPNRQAPDLKKDPNGLDNSYMRYKYELVWDWATSVKTRFDGQVGYVEQRYDHNSNFNFTGIVSRANLKWLATEKSNFLLSGWREFSQAANVNTSFILRQGIGLTPTWMPSPKIQLLIPASYEQQSYLGTVPETDNIWLTGLNLLYKPSDNVELGMLMQHEQRHSTVSSRTYKSESVGLNLRVTF